MAASPFDERAYRNALSHFPTGVAVITASTPHGPVGMTLQSFMSLSLEPALIALAIDRASTTWPKVAAVGRLSVNVLAEHQKHLALQFARGGIDKFSDVEILDRDGDGGPLLRGSLAWFSCSITQTHAGGDHIIAICSISDFRTHDTDDAEPRPLLFFRSRFPELARATTNV